MVTRSGVYNLLILIQDLSYIYERCRSAVNPPVQSTPVKGHNFILDVIKRQLPTLEHLSKSYPSLGKVHSSVKDTIVYFDRKYPDKAVFLGPQVNIDVKDANKLLKDSEQWINEIINEYSKSRTVLIREENIDEIFTEKLLSDLDELTRNDLIDSFLCIFNLLPTPAAMICFRATESIIRKYYTKVTSKSATGKSWSILLDELKQNQRTNQALIGYLDYLRNKRNEAEHPDKRFTQEESERVLIHVKGLLEELNKIV